MTRKRSNTPTTHFNHVDRVHSKRIIELATGICEAAIDFQKMEVDDCLAERRDLRAAVVPLNLELALAKRQGRAGDIILIGNRIDAISRRLSAVKARLAELQNWRRLPEPPRIGGGKRFLKVALREMLSEDLAVAVMKRASELEAAANQLKGEGA